MDNYCKFCWCGKTHTDDCPRNEPGAEERYETGYSDGRREKPRASDDIAYRSGYRNGEVAAEEAQNGCPW